MMSEEEDWERPVGLTADCAIYVDDSDDDVDVANVNQEKVTSKACVSSYSRNHVHRNSIGNAASSYFHNKSLNKNREDARGVCARNGDLKGDCNRKSPGNNRNGGDQPDNHQKHDYAAKRGLHEINPRVDENKSPKIMSTITEVSSCKDFAGNGNPFAAFAFKEGLASSSWPPKKRPRENNSAIRKSHTRLTQKKNGMQQGNEQVKKKKQIHSFFSKSHTTGSSRINTVTKAMRPNQPIQAETEEAREKQTIERQELIKKWHAFADPNAPIEQKRFQLLVAARLHARCQAPVVAKAMDRLRKYFDEKDCSGSAPCGADASIGVQSTTQSQFHQTSIPQASSRGLTVHSLASSDPDTEIVPLLSSVLFGNTKAKQIVHAAQDVLKKFGGRVPESICSLKDIAGIGPKLAQILNVVNRREVYS